MKRRHLGLCSILLLVPSAPCPAGQPTDPPQPAAPQPAQPQPAAAQPAATPAVTLLEAGAGPHQALRFRPRIGMTQAIEMTVKISTEQSLGDIAMPTRKAPTTRYALEVTVTGISEEGDVSYGFHYRSAEAPDEPGADPFIAQMMREALKSVAGLRGTGVISDRGFSKSIKFESQPNMDPVPEQSIKAIERSMRQLISRFPAEPVGVGASWKVQDTFQQHGITAAQTSVVNLLAADGDKIDLRVEISGEAEPQTVSLPGGPPGSTMEVKSFESRGTATTVLRLSGLFPQQVTADLTSDVTLVFEANGVQQELKQHTEAVTTMRSD
jgi:hypothetical protein